MDCICLIIIIFLRINFPLNRDLAVNEEFDCPTNEDPKSANPLNYRKITDPVYYYFNYYYKYNSLTKFFL